MTFLFVLADVGKALALVLMVAHAIRDGTGLIVNTMVGDRIELLVQG